jgi:hypothetical protein
VRKLIGCSEGLSAPPRGQTTLIFTQPLPCKMQDLSITIRTYFVTFSSFTFELRCSHHGIHIHPFVHRFLIFSVARIMTCFSYPRIITHIHVTVPQACSRVNSNPSHQQVRLHVCYVQCCNRYCLCVLWCIIVHVYMQHWQDINRTYNTNVHVHVTSGEVHLYA